MRSFLLAFAIITIISVAFLNSSRAWAQNANGAPAPAAPAAQGPSNIGGMQKPIEIRGQSRNLNMTLLLNNRTQAIQFVEPRKDYKKEIPNTAY